MTPQHLTIHGHRLAFRTAGSGPAVVLLHGMARSADTWRHVMPQLAERFTVVAPDLLGHGASAKPTGEYSVSGHANVVRDLLTALGCDAATIVGHSFGGGVAMQLAYQYPEQCARLVLVSSGGLGREVSPLLRSLSLPGAEVVLPIVCSAPLRDAARRLFGWLGAVGVRPAPHLEEVWEGYAGLTEPAARRAFFRTLRAVIDAGGQSVSATDRLYLASHVPTLIVWGSRDSLIPEAHALAAHDAIPGSRLSLFADAGHFPHCEQPERFLEVLRDFIADTQPARLAELTRRQLLMRA